MFAVCMTLAFVAGASAEDKEFTGTHPLKILKARYQSENSNGSAAASARGNLTVWIQNVTSVIVDGVDIDVELYNNRKRKVDTLKRNVDKLEPGEKKVLTFRWDVPGEEELSPRFFVEYNARGNQKERFEGDSPTWN